ncbi:MAG: ATP-grasp domain-containing protein [Nitrospinae bacterium]|nr:ATP-grasp domain-containing protein [Nitrospinota bacterium]
MRNPLLHLPSVHFTRGREIWPEKSSDYLNFERALKRLSRRALLMAGPEDPVILDGQVEENYLGLLRSLGAGGADILTPEVSAGASLADDVIKSPGVMEFIRRWQGGVEPYIMGPVENRIMDMAGKRGGFTNPAVVDLLNDKAFFLRLLEDMGMPFIPSYSGNSDAVASRIRKWNGGPIIVRGAKSVGGSRVFIARDADEKLALASRVERQGGGLYVLQPLMDVEESPNLQFYITDNEAILFGQSAQVMSADLKHTGNLFDIHPDGRVRAELLDQGHHLAREAALLGLRGVVGVDFIVTGQTRKVYAVEMNARHNTSTAALWFVNRALTGDPMVMADTGLGASVRIPAPGKVFSAARWLEVLGEFAFNPLTKRGALPMDTGGEELSAVIIGAGPEEREMIINGARLAAEGAI